MENKIYINRPMIIENVDNPEYINTLFGYNAINKDFWSSAFEKNYNKNFERYNALRDKVVRETNNTSNKSKIIQNRNSKGLKYISNIYLNLKTDPKWIDNIIAIEMLTLNPSTDVLSNINDTTEYVLEKIENYFNNK